MDLMPAEVTSRIFGCKPPWTPFWTAFSICLTTIDIAYEICALPRSERKLIFTFVARSFKSSLTETTILNGSFISRQKGSVRKRVFPGLQRFSKGAEGKVVYI